MGDDDITAQPPPQSELPHPRPSALRPTRARYGVLAAVCITLVFDRALELLLIAKNPRPKEALRTLKRWLVLPARLYLIDRSPRQAPVRVEVRDGDHRVTLEAARGRVSARVGPAEKPDTVIIGQTPIAWQLLLGKINLAQARKAGLEIQGKTTALKRFGVRPPTKAVFISP